MKMFDKIYDDIDRIFPDGLASVRLNGKWGFVDTTGSEVIPCKYDYTYGFSNGLAKVELDGKWGYIDKTGRVVIPLKYDWVGDFSKGVAKVNLNRKFGYIDTTGKEVIPCIFDGAIYDDNNKMFYALMVKNKAMLLSASCAMQGKRKAVL